MWRGTQMSPSLLKPCSIEHFHLWFFNRLLSELSLNVLSCSLKTYFQSIFKVPPTTLASVTQHVGIQIFPAWLRHDYNMQVSVHWIPSRIEKCMGTDILRGTYLRTNWLRAILFVVSLLFESWPFLFSVSHQHGSPNLKDLRAKKQQFLYL